MLRFGVLGAACYNYAVKAPKYFWTTLSLTSIGLPTALIQAIKGCLEDYTVDQRGDVGSLVRVEAIEIVLLAWQSCTLDLSIGRDLFASIVGLAAEKLDKVRSRAWHCLCGIYAVKNDPGTLNLGM